MTPEWADALESTALYDVRCPRSRKPRLAGRLDLLQSGIVWGDDSNGRRDVRIRWENIDNLAVYSEPPVMSKGKLLGGILLASILTASQPMETYIEVQTERRLTVFATDQPFGEVEELLEIPLDHLRMA